MLETNTFRTMMLIGGVLLAGLLFTSFFAAPIVEVDQSIKTSYQSVMGKEVGRETIHEDHLTIYELLLFNVEGRSRSSVRHY